MGTYLGRYSKLAKHDHVASHVLLVPLASSRKPTYRRDLDIYGAQQRGETNADLHYDCQLPKALHDSSRCSPNVSHLFGSTRD